MTWNDNSWTEERNEIKELRQYASKYELLSPEEEIELTNEYHDLKTRLIPLAYSISLAPAHEEYRRKKSNKFDKDTWSFILYYLVLRAKLVGEEIVKRNVRLVLLACQSQAYVGRGLPIFDLFMAGYDGLRYGCLVKYDPTKDMEKRGKGYKLSTYVTRWIHQRIGRAIRKTASAIKVAGHKADLMSKIRMVVKAYVANNNGEKPGPEAISLMLKKTYDKDIDPEEVSELGRHNWAILSLDQESEDEESQGLTMSDFLSADEKYEPEVALEFDELKGKLTSLLNILTEDERLIISYGHGLIDGQERKAKALAKLLGRPEKEIKDLVKSGMEKMSKSVSGKTYFNE